MDAKKIGIYLKEKRRGIEATQVELSEMLGVTHQAVSRWETGESIPDVIMLESLSELYNVSIDEIVKQESADNGVKKVELVNSNHSNILFGSIITILLFCVSTITLYFSFLRMEIWIWIILAVVMYAFSVLPFLYVNIRSVNVVQKRMFLRIVSDSLVFSVLCSVLFAFSKYTEIDIQNYTDFYYVFVSTGVFILFLVDYIVRFINTEQSETITQKFFLGLKNRFLVEVTLLTSFLVFIVAVGVLFPILRASEYSVLSGLVYFGASLIMIINVFYHYKVVKLISLVIVVFNIVTFIYITTLYGMYYGNGISGLDSIGGLLSMLSGLSAYFYTIILIGLFIYKSSKRIELDFSLLLYGVFVFMFSTIRMMIQTLVPEGYSLTGEHAWRFQSTWDRHSFLWIAILLLISLIITVNTLIHRGENLLKEQEVCC